jgi:tRNA(fMet)-specific endonuclease VapC
VSTLLLDTDGFPACSDHPLADVDQPDVKGHTLAIAFMTVAELFQGAFRAGWGIKKIERLESRIASYVVIPSSIAMSKRWAVSTEFLCSHR